MVQPCHRGRVALDARLIFSLIGPIKIAERRHVGTFAGGFRRARLRRLHLTPAVCHRAFGRPVPDLVEHAHRDAPMRHGAIWIGFRDLLELPLSLLVPKIVQQRDAADEGGSHRGGAGNREGHAAQALE